MEIRLSRMVFQVRKIADEAHQLLVINFNRRQLLMEIVVCKPSGYWLAIHCVHLNTLFLFTAILALRYLLMNRFRATKKGGPPVQQRAGVIRQIVAKKIRFPEQIHIRLGYCTFAENNLRLTMSETKQAYLMKFRKCSSFDTLEKVFERLCEKNVGIVSLEISGAYDHRKAELTMKKLYDKVSASVWTLVRQ